MIALCSAWIQQVLSVTFLLYKLLSLEHFLCDSKLAGGVLYHCQIILSFFTNIHQHLDLSQVAFCAIFHANWKYSSAFCDSSQVNILMLFCMYKNL
jgi:hypothetical protein